MAKKIRKVIKYKLLIAFVKGLLALCRTLPRTWVLGFFTALGKLSYYLLKDTRQLIDQHLTYAYEEALSQAERKQINRSLFVNIAKNTADIFISTKFKRKEQLDAIVENRGFEHLNEAHRKGKGVIILTCHMGAFELLGPNLAFHGYASNIVAKKLHNDTLDKLLLDHRLSYGGNVINSGENSIKLIRALKKGEVMLILIDQDLSKSKGIFVNFFNKPAFTPIGAAMLALRTGAEVVPMSIRRVEGEKHIITTLPAIPVNKTDDQEADLQHYTQLFSNALEGFIRQDPSQWVWMHKRWKTQPPVKVMADSVEKSG